MLSTAPKHNNEKIYNYLLIGFLFLFACLKFNDLFLPYFWDELGVYSQCAVYQYHNGLSLMPASVPPILSRGHPLLLTFLNALIMRVLGCKIWAPHAFHLFISIVFLLTIYNYIAKYFNRITGLTAVIILTVQPIFLAQSILLLPEMLLSLFAFLALVNYFERKYFMFSVFATLAILTKESAVVLPCAVLVYSVFQFQFYKQRSEAFLLRNSIFVFLPYFIFGIFLSVQKIQNGWYFFPYHIESVDLNWQKIIAQFSDFIDFIWTAQGRYWWKICLCAAIPIALFSNRLNWQNGRNNFLLLLILFACIFGLFSSLSFYMQRYVLAVLIPVAILIAVSLNEIFGNKFLLGVAILFLVYVAGSHFEETNFDYDNDMGYRYSISVVQHSVDFCAEISKGKELVYGNFPAYFAINFPESGYMKKNLPILSSKDFVDKVKYFILCKPGADTYIDNNRFDDSLIATFTDSYAKAEIHQLKKK